MARAKAKPVSRRAQQESQIRRLVVLDALKGMGAPAVAGAGIFILWVLLNAELMQVGPALTLTGLLMLFIMVHFGLRDFLSERTAMNIGIGVGVFGVVWLVGLGWPLQATINPPPPIFAGELKPNAAPATVPLNGESGQYRIVVSGHLPQAQSNDRSTHGGRYHLAVKDGVDLDETLDGDFSETWQRQRIGRKGGLPVRVVHSVVQHRFTSSSGHDVNLSVLDLNGNAGNSVGVEVFHQAVSTVMLLGIALLLTAAALVVDAWRTDEKHDGLMTMQTLAAAGGVAAFRSFAAAHPGFGDLLVNGIMGGIPGAGIGVLVWWLTGKRLRKLLGTEE